MSISVINCVCIDIFNKILNMIICFSYDCCWFLCSFLPSLVKFWLIELLEDDESDTANQRPQQPYCIPHCLKHSRTYYRDMEWSLHNLIKFCKVELIWETKMYCPIWHHGGHLGFLMNQKKKTIQVHDWINSILGIIKFYMIELRVENSLASQKSWILNRFENIIFRIISSKLGLKICLKWIWEYINISPIRGRSEKTTYKNKDMYCKFWLNSDQFSLCLPRLLSLSHFYHFSPSSVMIYNIRLIYIYTCTSVLFEK